MSTKRPLLDTAADLQLFISDNSRLRAEKSAFQLNNTLLVGEPGSGKTSLLYKIRGNANSHDSDPPRAVLVDARLAQSPEALASLISTEAAKAGWILEADAPPRADDPFAAVSEVRRLQDAPRNSMVLIDDPSAEQAAVLFGRLRDELWQLPVWLTAAVRPVVERDVLVRPPADAFFDARIELEPLAPDDAYDLLRRRRGTGDPITSSSRPMQPRTVLMIAEGSPDAIALYDGQLQHRLLEHARETAGFQGTALVTEIWNRGAVSASDADLQRNLGLSRPRLTQLLASLEQAGILRASRDAASGTTGRPRQLYDINKDQ